MILSLVLSSFLTLVELNCENLFDCKHDSLKQDSEWTPASVRHWTPDRYWRKVNHIGQTILSCQEESVPDLVALVEVENDSCLFDLTRRSLLCHAGYQYLMTESPDERGIDVALLYQPMSFRPLCYETFRITPMEGMRPTRDILYVKGEILHGDTLHVFVVHAPSRYGGERQTRPFRQLVADRLAQAVDSIRCEAPEAQIIIVGDFNDEATSPALLFLANHDLHNVTADTRGSHGAEGTYYYQGEWGSIDHVLVSRPLVPFVEHSFVNDSPFLLEEDNKYGGVKPLRTYRGMRYQPGFSDHLPLVVQFRLPPILR
ncbi:MAG: endonuclease/exonuclease/phosphatase family protein [Prevotella sp.]|nr:endonuclease/exonuclease/phosphatase family protein [Prevotella sp.]